MCPSPRLIAALLLFPVLLVAQQPGSYPRTMYTSYDKAPIYRSADYLSEITGHLRLGDSVQVLASEGKYFRISTGDGAGFVLWSNLSIQRAEGKKTKKTPSRKDLPAAAGDVRRSPEPVHSPSGTTMVTNRVDSTESGQDAVGGDPGDRPAPAAAPTGNAPDEPRAARKKSSSAGASSSGKTSERPQCTALTKAGKQCSRRAADNSSYCWQHNR